MCNNTCEDRPVELQNSTHSLRCDWYFSKIQQIV